MRVRAVPRRHGHRGRPEPRAPKRSHRTAWIVAAVAAAVLVIAGGLAAAFEAKVFTPSHPVPAMSGLTLTAAESAASKVHMNVRASDAKVQSISIPTGDIVAQSPAAGSSQKQGTTVTVVLSDGPPNVTVPSLTGMTCAVATTTLEAAHFKAVCAPPRYDNTTPAGELVLWSIGATANPTKAPYGSTITLVPSQGHPPVPVPTHPLELHLCPGAGCAAGGRTGGSPEPAGELERDLPATSSGRRRREGHPPPTGRR